MINPDRPTPFPPAPSSSGSSVVNLPESSLPRGLEGDFEAPHLLVPVDRSNPSRVIGNGFVAQLSSTVSTLIQYDIRPAYAGKTCTLAFHMPAPFDYPELSPVKIRSPGGISVFRVNRPITAEVSAQDVGGTSPIGSIPSIDFGHQYNIASGPCEAAQRMTYQFDAVGGLDMNWFQIVNPPLGPFIMVS